MKNRLFCELADVYEAMVDWPKRLSREAPFYRRLFDQFGVRRVLDAACGTGRHAAMFHQWGLEVEGADVSPEMISRAKARFGERQGLRWATRSFDLPATQPISFDAAICVGNSLALAEDKATIERAVEAMAAALRDNGLLVIQMLNLWSLADGPCHWQKCQWIELPQGRLLILKGVHRCGSRGYVDLIVTDASVQPAMQKESAELVGLEAHELVRMAQHAGAVDVDLYGDYQREPYDPAISTDLILVAKIDRSAKNKP